METRFGIKALLKNYSFGDFIKDITIPLIVSSVLVMLSIYKKIDTLVLLSNIISLALEIVPALFALLLTAYLFLLTFFQAEKLQNILGSQKGKELYLQLNANFALCVLVAIIALSFSLTIYFVLDLGLCCIYADIINYVAIFTLSLFLGFLVKIQFDIAVDLYNCGQTIVL
ncbi:hypothetical protein [Methanobrevibacter sp.]|uniref:hypothetical protein n=1 Tax=Methanobrevibacter sp. TaxID=66852 RepID=UPI0038684218